MNKKVFLLLFLGIFLFGTILRFYRLGEIPNSLNWDEVSWGYNAYAIAETGKDEHGASLPLSFEAFGDYKQPLYVYAQVIPIKLFGVTPFAVRFPSAFFGSLTIIFVFLLVYELLRKERFARHVALLAMFFFAVSPWSVHFSRVAYEANVGLFFVISGVWLFLKAIYTKKNWYFFVAILLLSLSMYTYHSQKLFTPLLFIVLLVYGWKYLIERKKLIVVLLLFFLLCNLFWIIDPRTTHRGRSVLFTGSFSQGLDLPDKEAMYDIQRGDHIGAFLHNRRFTYAQRYIEKYFAHFDLNWLFIKGDNPRHHTPGMGLLYLIELPLILIGMVYLINKRKRYTLFLFAWLFLAPVASSLTIESTNASRSLVFLPTWQIFTALGCFALISSLQRYRRFVIAGIILLFVVSVYYFVHQLFVHGSDFAEHWQYGYKDAVLQAKEYDKEGKKVFFSKSFEQPYIFYLFYNAYDPKKYQEQGGSERIVKSCFTIDNIFFGACENYHVKGAMVFTIKGDSLKDASKFTEIPSSTGENVITVYEVR